MAEQVLIRTPNHLGDCIMALPMINEAREAYPGGEISLLVPETLHDLFHPNPAIDNIYCIPAEHVHGLLAVVKIRDLIADRRFDVGYILPPSFGAAAGFKLGGVKERIGYIADGRRLLLTKPLALPTPINSTHRSELYFNLLRRGTGADITYVRPKLFLNDEDIERGKALLSGFEINDRTDFAVIAFRAVAESRRWGQDNYTALTKRLVAGYQMPVVLTGTSEDKRVGDDIVAAAGSKRVVNLAGKTTIREAAAVYSLARFFVGNDSGPAHLAAAVGLPVIVLSGADDPRSTSPMAAHKRLLYRNELECISCVKNKCPLKGSEHMQCMSRISIDDVVGELDRLLAETA